MGHAGPSRSHGLRSSCHTRNSVVDVAFVLAECLFNTNLQSVCPAQSLQAFVQHKTCRVFVQREACRAFVQREACRAFVQHKACRVFVQRKAQGVCVLGCFNANLSMPKGVCVCWLSMPILRRVLSVFDVRKHKARATPPGLPPCSQAVVGRTRPVGDIVWVQVEWSSGFSIG